MGLLSTVGSALAGPVGGAIIGGLGSFLGGREQRQGFQDQADAALAAAQLNADLQSDIYNQNRMDAAPYRGTGLSALGQLASLYGLYDPAIYSPAYSDLYSQPLDGGGGSELTSPLYGYNGRQLARLSPSEIERLLNNASSDPILDRFGREQIDRLSPAQMDVLMRYSSGQGYDPGAVEGGAGVGSMPQPTGLAGFYASPEYMLGRDAMQFGLDEGTRGLDRMAAASGMLLSGAHTRDLSRYATDYANQYLGQQFGNYRNSLASLAGIGQTANQGVAAGGMNAAGNAGRGYLAGGMAAGNAYGHQGIAQGNMWTNLANVGTNALENYAYEKAMGNNLAQGQPVGTLYDGTFMPTTIFGGP